MSKILLHIGYPKAASSFLGDWFKHNPNFSYKDFAIGGFSDTLEFIQFATNRNRTDKDILVVRDMRFSAPNWYDCKDVNNIEIAQQKIAESLFQLFPTAKILVVTRGFKSAIKANYSQYLKEGGFLDFTDFYDANKNSNWLPFNYSFLIDLYKKKFGQENLLVLPFELIKTDSIKFLKNIELFLELPAFTYYHDTKNQSLSSKKLTLIRKLNRFIYFALFIFGPLHSVFYKRYVKILDKYKTKSWNNFLMDLFSKLLKPTKIEFNESDDITEQFTIFGQKLRYFPEFEPFKKEYYFD